MNTLTIFYDARCGLCSRVRRWLVTQATYVRLEFLAYDSPAAQKRCPIITRLKADQEIVVMADTGEVWQGAAAWVMCLWALRDYREWSARFAGPTMQAVARKIVHLVSDNRLSLSRLLHFKSDTEIRYATQSIPDDATCSLSS
jgi:predicted DCC family thiol-disulfide oxidoreductase YuxK